LSLVALCAATILVAGDDSKARNDWTISAERVYTGTGKTIEGGEVTVADGKIRSVSKGGGGDLECYAITPGLIDLSVRIERAASSIEQSREVTPEKRIAIALDWFDEAWKREARSGVTTVMINPLERQVIGGLSVVVKTAGDDAKSRTVKADSALYGAIGSAPSASNHPAFGRPDDFYSRRPTTRMGVEWEWRKAFFDAAMAREDKSLAGPGTLELQKALSGDLPLVIQTWTTQDIRTAVFLKEELAREGLGKLKLVVDAAAEAWREPDLLVRSATAAILPPFSATGRTTESAFFALDTAKVLTERGVTIALSGHGAADVSERLCYQPGHAMRGGLSFDAALAAVTINPARIAGIDKRVGSLEAGKDADLVLWSGPPFEPTSAVIGVLVDGRLVLDPRTQNK
jgi:imidazolonepropionase-like amidohydrolase